MMDVKISLTDGNMSIPICRVECEPLKEPKNAEPNGAENIEVTCYFAALVRTLQHHTSFFNSFALKNQWFVTDQRNHSMSLTELLDMRYGEDFSGYRFREKGYAKPSTSG